MNRNESIDAIKFSRTFLFVDDDEKQCASAKRLANIYDVNLQTANSGHSALALIQSDPEKFFLILTDQFMPGMDGDELLDKVKNRWPHIRRAMISADETSEAITKAYETGDIFRYLRKPASEETIKELIEDACKHAISLGVKSNSIVKDRKALLGELIKEVFQGSPYERLFRHLENDMLLHCQQMCQAYNISRLPLIEVEKDSFKRELRASVKESLTNILHLLENSADARKNFTISGMMKQFDIHGLRSVDRSLPYNEALFSAFVSRFISYYELVGLNKKKMITVTADSVEFGAGDRYIYNDIFNPVLSSVYKGIDLACLQLESLMLLVALRMRGTPEIKDDLMSIKLVLEN